MDNVLWKMSFFCTDDNFDFISNFELNGIDDNEVDYTPFSSKAQALLFFLIHSPRPMVIHYYVIINSN